MSGRTRSGPWPGAGKGIAALAVVLGAPLSLAWAVPQEETIEEAVATATNDSYESIDAEYQAATKAFEELYRAAKTEEDQQKAFEKYPNPGNYAGRFLAVAAREPGGDESIQCWSWVVRNAYSDTACRDAIGGLLPFVAREDVALLGQGLAYTFFPESRAFLRAVLAEDHSAEIRANTWMALGQFLKRRADFGNRVREAGDQDPAAQYYRQAYGEEFMASLVAEDPAELTKEAESCFETVQADAALASVASRDTTLGARAGSELFEMRNLVVGKVAPDIEGSDLDGVAFKLSDYRGKVVMLDFWGNW